MPRVTIPEAAARLGVSTDTVRRRIRAGLLPSERDGRGRYLVEVDGFDPGHPPPSPGGEHLDQLLRERDQLLTLLATQERHLEAHTVAEVDLRRMLEQLLHHLTGG